MSTFYKKYISLCAKANKSPSAIAEAIGLSRTSPNGWKKGNKPKDTTLEKLATYFDVPASYFSEDNASFENNEKSAMNDTFEMASAEEKMDLAARLISSLTEEQQAAFIQRIMFKK